MVFFGVVAAGFGDSPAAPQAFIDARSEARGRMLGS
jgi:hypothetical protein